MIWHSQRQAGQASPREVGDSAMLRDVDDQSERTRPEGFNQFQSLTTERALRLRHFQTGNMSDQRVEARTSLGRVKSRDSLCIGCIRSETIDRLCRHSDETTGAQQICCTRDGIIRRGQDWGTHAALICRAGLNRNAK